jgi:hypothetical protein
LINTAKVIEITSRMRINLLKSTDFEKAAVASMTDEESKTFAEQSQKSADAVDRDYAELKVLIDATNIDKEIQLLKEFSTSWNHFRVIDEKLLSLAVENTNIKAENLSYTAGAQAVANFEQSLSALMDVPKSEGERAQVAKLAYRAITAAFMIYSLEAPHINEAEDRKMNELENIMAANEKEVHNALLDLSRLTGQQSRTISHDASSAFSKFMEVHREVLRLSRANTNIISAQLSLGQKQKVAAQCEEILNALLDAVQNGRLSNATR